MSGGRHGSMSAADDTMIEVRRLAAENERLTREKAELQKRLDFHFGHAVESWKQEVADLEAKNERLASNLQTEMQLGEQWRKERLAARAENERLRAALTRELGAVATICGAMSDSTWRELRRQTIDRIDAALAGGVRDTWEAAYAKLQPGESAVVGDTLLWLDAQGQRHSGPYRAGGVGDTAASADPPSAREIVAATLAAIEREPADVIYIHKDGMAAAVAMIIPIKSWHKGLSPGSHGHIAGDEDDGVGDTAA